MYKRLLVENLSRIRPFCLFGAKGVGKTTMVRHFAEKFSNWIHLDLDTVSDRAIFHSDKTDEETFMAINFLKGQEIRGNGTLIVLDEIYKCPEAISWIARRADGWKGGRMDRFTGGQVDEWTRGPLVVATSSILTNELIRLINPESGDMQPHNLYPFSFEEFLMALDDRPVLEAFREVPVPHYAYKKLLNYFHLYALIGGMPEITSEYAANRRLTELKNTYAKIENRFIQCLGDVTPGKKSRDLAIEVLQNTYPYAATRISFNRFGNLEKGTREISQAFKSLEHTFFLQMIYPVTSTTLPLMPDTSKFPRLQLLDTGLVNYFSGIQKPLFQSHDMIAIFEGQIARQVVGQELQATASYNKTGHTGLKEMTDHTHPTESHISESGSCFWVRSKAQSSATVDFVISFNDMLIPVVVRSGEPGRLRSLHQFLDESPYLFAVRLHSGELGIRQSKTIKGKKYYLLSLPYFLAGKINEHLTGFRKYVES